MDAYVVKRGDSLGKIAREHGISTEELAEMNRDTILQAARSQGVKSEDLMKCANYIFPGGDPGGTEKVDSLSLVRPIRLVHVCRQQVNFSAQNLPN